MSNHRIVFKTFFLILALGTVFTVIITVMKEGSMPGSDEMSNVPTFFEQFVASGGPIVWFVLLPMSVITVYLAVDYSLTIRRKRLLPLNVKENILQIITVSGLKGLQEQNATVKEVKEAKTGNYLYFDAQRECADG